jgi:hypothetical protein
MYELSTTVGSYQIYGHRNVSLFVVEEHSFRLTVNISEDNVYKSNILNNAENLQFG